MSEIRGLTLFILFVTMVSVTRAQNACLESELCYCQDSESTFIDLTPIRSKRLQAKKGLHTYEIQLCETFELQEGCIGVYGCQIRKFLPKYVSLGNAVHFTDSINITYTGGDGTTIIQLLCNTKVDATFDFLKESPKKTFNFILQSKYACPQPLTTTSTLPVSDSTQGTTQTDSTGDSGESTTTSELTTGASETTGVTSELTTGTSEPTAITSELTTGASGPSEITSDLTTGASEQTTVSSESTTGASESTSEATATTGLTVTTDTTPTTTHGDADRLSSLTLCTIFLLVLLPRTLL